MKRRISIVVLSALFLGFSPAARSAQFQPVTSQDVGLNPRGLAVGDLIGDGSEQLAVANFGSPTFIGMAPPTSASQNSNVQVFNNGAAGLVLSATIPTASSPRGLAIYDLFGNGRGDLLVTSYGTNALQVFGKGANGFVKEDEAPTGILPVGVAAGKIKHGSSTFAAVTDYGANQVSLFPVVNGKLGKRIDVSVDPGPVQLAIGNLGGPYNSIAVACMGSAKIDILSPKSNDLSTYSVTSTLSLPPGASPSDLRLADLNGDGKIDLVVADFVNNDIQIFLQNGSGSFTALAPLATSGQHPNGLTVGDLDGDGRNEIIVANRDSDSLDIFSWSGTQFQLTQTVTLTTGGGKADLGPVEVALLNKGTGPKMLVTTHMRSNSVKSVPFVVPTATPDPVAVIAARETRSFSADTTYCYPNPAHGGPVKVHFDLAAPAPVEIQAFDVTGTLVFSENFSPSQTVAGDNGIDWNLENQAGNALASGTYLIRVSTGGQSAVRKLSVIH